MHREERTNADSLTFEEIEFDKPSLENLKTDINQLLWEYLPGKTTLEQAEEVAWKIYNLIAGK